MRLTTHERQCIKTVILKRDPHAQVFLFGSRVDDGKKGGDIDLLVISESLAFQDKISILVDIKTQLGDQKIDLVLANEKKIDDDPFLQAAKDEGMIL